GAAVRDVRDVAAHDAPLALSAELADHGRLPVQIAAAALDGGDALAREESVRRGGRRLRRHDRQLDGRVLLGAYGLYDVRQILPPPIGRDSELKNQLRMVEPVVAEEPVPRVRAVDRALEREEMLVAADACCTGLILKRRGPLLRGFDPFGLCRVARQPARQRTLPGLLPCGQQRA